MKASISIIKVSFAGFKLIYGRKKEPSRLFSSATSSALQTSSSLSDDQGFLLDDSIFVKDNDQDPYVLPSLKCISAECTEVHDELSFGFGENNICEFVDDKDFFMNKFHQKAEDDIELKRIKLILGNRGWNLGSRKNSYSEIDLNECNIIRILNDLFEESREAALALYFFRWSECCIGSNHTLRSVCTMIHILVAGNMNHRAMDLIFFLVRRNDGQDWWLNLLFKVLHETRTERRILVTVYSMLVDCFVKENMTNAALKLTCQMKHLNVFPSIGVCNSLLRALLLSEQMELAWDFLEDIQGFGFNASTISLFIHKYCSKGNLESGWRLLMEMKNYGINPDVVAYTILIDSLHKMSFLREATSILFKMIQMGVSIDSVSVSSVIDGYCKVGKSEKAIDVLKIFRPSPNVYIYNSFISKLCADSNMAAASYIFHEMLELGLLPDCFSYTTIIGGFCKIRDVNAAINFVGKMLKRGIKPSVTTYTTLIDGYCKSGDVDMAEHLFQNMITAGLVPDVVAYNTLMDGYGRKGHLHKAFGLLDMMNSAGISPDIVTYNTVIHSLLVRGFASEAKAILDELIRRGLSPDVVTFTNIISDYSKKGNFEEAFLVWFYMSEHHMKPDVVTCSALLNGYCRERRMEEANVLFCKMLDIGLVPDLMLYNILIHGFCSVSNIDDACLLVNMMVKHGISPNDVTHRALVLGYEKKKVQNPVETAAFKVQQIQLKCGISMDVDQ